jgi:TolA-binding protein
MDEERPSASPSRLSGGGTDLDELERAASEALRLAAFRSGLRPVEVERVRVRLAASQAPRGRDRRLSVALAVAFALSALGLTAFAGPGLVRAVRSWRLLGARDAGAGSIALSRTAGHATLVPIEGSRSAPGPAEPEELDRPPRESQAELTKLAGRMNRRPATTRRHRVASADAATVTARPPARAAAMDPAGLLGDEATLVERGMRLLHQDRDPDAAITVMSEYIGRYPRGALLAEARLTLIEALLERGRAHEALSVLADVEPQDTVRGRELTALRGELLAQAGRCREAVTDFATVLRRDAGDLAEERAWVGTARCRARNGDAAGARDALGRYLVRFPRGRFAPAARAELGQ